MSWSPSWSEDRLHRWLAAQPRPQGLAGSVLHDAAVLRDLEGLPVVCVDQCIEGVHFDARASATLVGRKAAARALSDLAATAAEPRALLLALSAPKERDEAWIQRAIRGVRAMAHECGCDLVGGDLALSPGPVKLAVSAIGAIAIDASKPVPIPGRDRARPGQHVIVTGRLGGSLLGRHLRIQPRIEEGIWLRARGATALMDVSDGLAWDLFRLARASGVRIDLETDRLPIHADAERMARRSGQRPLDHALGDGEDHELIATVPPAALDRVLREASVRCPFLCAIGRVKRGSGLWLFDPLEGYTRWDPSAGESRGFRHGA